MIELKALKRQLDRLEGLHNRPDPNSGVWRELAKMLQRRCSSMEHAERVINRWLESEIDYPTPVQIYMLAGDVPADRSLDNPLLADPCPQCAPEGMWRIAERKAENGETVEVVERCGCPRGRQLAALDAARKTASSKPKRKGPGRITRVSEILHEGDAS